MPETSPVRHARQQAQPAYRARSIFSSLAVSVALVCLVALVGASTVRAAAGWSSANSLPIPLHSQAAFTDGSFVYIAGGKTTSGASSVVYSAQIQAGGVLGPWHKLTSLPQPLFKLSGVQQSGFAVILGGQGLHNVAQATVYTAPLQTGGAIGAWTPTTPLPSARFEGAAVAAGGAVYQLGGFDAQDHAAATVTVAAQSGGSLGAWAQTTPLPRALAEIGAVASNGRLYVVGGHTAENGAGVATVSMATIGSAGQLGGWSALTPLPQARWDLGVAIADGFLWAIGGYSATARATTTVYRAPLQSNGSIGAWQSVTALPAPVAEGTLTTAQGYLFVAGGKVGGSGASAQLFTALASGL